MLPLREHGESLSKQFLAACSVPTHPGHKFLGNRPPKRNQKATFLEHEEEVTERFRENSYKDVIKKKIHTATVGKTIDLYPPNRVLQCKPPDINPEEQTLSRKARSSLARLRSGFSRDLNSYLCRIEDDVLDVCYKCDQSHHDTVHLFNCISDPTDIKVISLINGSNLFRRILYLSRVDVLFHFPSLILKKYSFCHLVLF